MALRRPFCLRLEELENRAVPAIITTHIAALGQSDGSVVISDPLTQTVVNPSFRPLDANGQQYSSLVAVTLGDVNDDGVPDLFVAAQKRAGIASLDPSKAGKVFVYSGADLLAGTADPANPIDTFTPFATPFSKQPNPDGTTAYQTGFELATGDVNGDGVPDLIASSRGDVGQLVVQSTAAGHAQLGATSGPNGAVTPFGTTYIGKIEVAAGNFLDESNGGNPKDQVATARGNSDSLDPNVPGTRTRVAVLNLVNSVLSPVALSGAINADGTLPDIRGTTGQVIDRNAFVAALDVNGNGVDSLVFAARDFVSQPANPHIVIGVYGISANGSASLQTVNDSGDNAAIRAGNQVGSYSITAGAFGGVSGLALVQDGPSAGLLVLNAGDGTQLGSTSFPVLVGGVRIAVA